MVRPPSEILPSGKAMKRIFLILVLSVVVLGGQAFAQDIPLLSDLQISLWPEYDRPEVLVIYRGLFAEDTPLPIPVEISIPAEVGEPTAVAYIEGGERLNQQYTTRVSGDWLVVAFELNSLAFQLEYYDALPADAEGRREYTYAYAADYPITNLNLDFQVPPTAQGFALEPSADSVITESDGLVYHLVDAGTLAQGEERSWTFAYQKDNEELTVSAPETAVPATGGAVGGTDNSTVLIFLVAFVALVVVGAAAFWLGRRTQPLQPEPLASPRPKRRGSGRGSQIPRQRPPSSGGQEAPFCHHCGAELRADSEFCHKCGTAVRRG
jgi:hypothetical protein